MMWWWPFLTTGAMLMVIAVAISRTHWKLGSALAFIADILLGIGMGWPWGVSAFACAAWIAWRWWNRHRRKRAPRSYGYKARARIAALIAKARETIRLRPALRPVPGGAR